MPPWIGILCALAEPAPSVAIVIAPTEQGTEFASQLAGELDEPATVRTSTISFHALLDVPELHWPERYLVFADPSEARILVIRPEDRTLLLRALDPDAARAAPFALAVAAAELLRAARATEKTSGDRIAQKTGLALGASVAVGVSVVEAFGYEPILVQGTVEVDLELLDRERDLWSTIGLALEATGTGERTSGEF